MRSRQASSQASPRHSEHEGDQAEAGGHAVPPRRPEQPPPLRRIGARDTYERCCAEVGCRPNSAVWAGLGDYTDAAGRVVYLRLQHNLLGEKGARALAATLATERMSALQSLSLRSCGLTSADACELAAALAAHARIRSVDLSQNEFGRASGFVFLRLTAENTRIVRLLLDSQPPFVDEQFAARIGRQLASNRCAAARELAQQQRRRTLRVYLRKLSGFRRDELALLQLHRENTLSGNVRMTVHRGINKGLGAYLPEVQQANAPSIAVPVDGTAPSGAQQAEVDEEDKRKRKGGGSEQQLH